MEVGTGEEAKRVKAMRESRGMSGRRSSLCK